MIRCVAIFIGFSVVAAGCSVVERRSPEERYCRAALKDLTRNGAGAKVDDADTNARSLNGRKVAAVTLAYVQGPTKRLMTCFFFAGGVRPVRINYRGAPLSRQQLNSLHRRIGK